MFPWRESGSPSPFFYSYDYGAAHIISLSNYVYAAAPRSTHVFFECVTAWQLAVNISFEGLIANYLAILSMAEERLPPPHAHVWSPLGHGPSELLKDVDFDLPSGMLDRQIR